MSAGLWLLGVVVAGAVGGLAAQSSPQDRLVFVGTYTGASSRGIYAFRFNDATGALTPIGLAAETPNPSFLTASADSRFVFAVNEVSSFDGGRSGSITSFAVDAASGRLTLINVQSSKGADPCHLALDATGRFLAVANYSGGTFVLVPVGTDGHLGEARMLSARAGSGPNLARQAGPHAHGVTFDATNEFLLGADLGIDQVLVYRFDAAAGTAVPHTRPSAFTDAGAGPRHLALHPTEPLLFVINELSSTIDTFEWNETSGDLAPHGSYPTLPGGYAGSSTTAEIAIHPNGRFVYGSNRGHDSITVFGISGDGQLALVEHTPTGGRTPRNFAIDPTGRWLIAGNQDSNTLAVFAIDPVTGRLTATGSLTEAPAPVSILFLP
jgi:6-phosphogluconolactonase